MGDIISQIYIPMYLADGVGNASESRMYKTRGTKSLIPTHPLHHPCAISYSSLYLPSPGDW
jgi:hypothetical protein